MATQKIYVIDPKEMWDEALAFEKCSTAIHNEATKQIIKNNNENLAVGMTYAANVNHAYSFEILLKCLMVIEYGYFYWGHDLLELFRALPQGTQDEIIHNNDILTIRRRSITQAIFDGGDFVKSLTQASNAFVDYRYLYNGKQAVDDYDLSFPMNYVKYAILKRRPDFENNRPHSGFIKS